MEPIITFEHTSFRYADEPGQVLKDISLSFAPGSFTCILGHNGSGKSTLAKLMNALLIPTEGKVTSFGLDTAQEANEIPIRRNVGMVFQNPDNQIVATVVEDDVAFGPENLGIPRAEIRRRVDDALKMVGMYEYRRHEPHKLSGGQKQRVAIAGVIAMQTKCIVLDEPTAMLDPKGRREVLSALHRLNTELGIAVILVTHFMDEAVNAGRVIVMNDGEIALDGTPHEVFSHAQELAAMGLEVPGPAQLMKHLQEAGLPVAGLPLTSAEFSASFAQWYNQHNG